MKRAVGSAAVVILAGFAADCEEINYVRVVAPNALVGATVTVRGGQQSAKLVQKSSQSTVETDEDLPLPPLTETLVVERGGCETITLAVPGKIGRTTVVIRADQVRCDTGR
jgi:hypothetical protein